MNSVERFLEKVEDFETVAVIEAEDLVSSKDGHTLFIGRETCPYCVKFINKLHKASQENDLPIYYLRSENPLDQESIAAFRKKYNIATVPSLIYSDENGVKTVSDSSLSVDEILEFINK